jgi:hypothetical protein
MKRLACCCLVLASVVLPAADRGPTSPVITVVDGEIPLRKALDQLSTQSHFLILNGLDADDNPKLALNLKSVSFWEALDRIAEDSGAQLDLYRSDGKIQLVRRGSPPRCPLSYSGPFRVAIKKLSAVHDFANSTHGLTLILETAWDPSFEPFYLDTRPQQLALTDDAGKAVPMKAMGSSWGRVDGARALTFDLSLPPLPRASARIGTLKGSFPVLGTERMHEFRWKNADGKEFSLYELSRANLPLMVSAGKERTVCTLRSVRLAAQAWTIQVETELPENGPKLESHQTWYTHNRLYLETRDGKRRLPWTTYNQDSGGEQKAVLNYRFTDAKGQRGDPKDWVLVYEAPPQLVETSIPFEFKNVRLP